MLATKIKLVAQEDRRRRLVIPPAHYPKVEVNMNNRRSKPSWNMRWRGTIPFEHSYYELLSPVDMNIKLPVVYYNWGGGG